MKLHKAPESPLILPMLEGDLEAVDQINQASFAVPWNRKALEEEMARKWAFIRVLRIASGEKICGFINFWEVSDEFHLQNIAIAPAMRGRGLGTALLQDMFQIACKRSISSILLEVRRSNRPAIELYRRFGFEKIGVRPLYYSDNQEDAVVMRCETPCFSQVDRQYIEKIS